MNIENKLTILLILKGRHQFTYRWLEYYKYNLSKYKLLIADGSKNNLIENYIAKNYNDSKITYIYYGPDINLEKYSLKVTKALKEIDTEYVLQSSNDDFYSIDSIDENINFLEKNIEYCCSRSEIYDFSVESYREVSGYLNAVSKIYNDVCFNENDNLNRITSFSKNFNSLWHDVSRTKIMLKAWESVCSNKIYFFPFQDIYLSFVLTIYGKINHSKGIYMLHQNHREMLARDEAYGTISSVIINGNFSQLNLTISSISKELFNNNKIEDLQFNHYLIYELFIGNFILKAIKNENNYKISFQKKLKIGLKKIFRSSTASYPIYILFHIIFKKKIIYKDNFINDVSKFVKKRNILSKKTFKID